jgi:DNA-binding MarR family transcriptional regulator
MVRGRVTGFSFHDSSLHRSYFHRILLGAAKRSLRDYDSLVRNQVRSCAAERTQPGEDVGVSALQQLFSDLIRFETELWDAIDARLRVEHGLPLHKFEPMQIIARTPNCRVLDIAGALSLTTGGVSKLVDAIEATGHCARRPNPDDRRSSIIELTDRGHQALDNATQTFEAELQRRLGAAVPDRALAQFSTTLRRLRAASRQADASAAA